LEPRRAFGSRILLEPELGFGYRFSERLSAEASWVHMSHGGLSTIGRIRASTTSEYG
jgi:hypothetical protein